MRHKVLMALENLIEKQPVMLSGISEFDETFVLESYKGSSVPEEAGLTGRTHGAVASKPGISSEYVAICTGIQRDGGQAVKFCVSDIRQSQGWRCENRAESWMIPSSQTGLADGAVCAPLAA